MVAVAARIGSVVIGQMAPLASAPRIARRVTWLGAWTTTGDGLGVGTTTNDGLEAWTTTEELGNGRTNEGSEDVND